jgi:putative oxidoreductase
MKARVKEIIDNQWLIFALRVALGGLFIAASVSKLPHQAEFINAVTSYGIMPYGLARFYALVVPWAELAIGCALVLGIFPRLASVLSIPLIVSFIVANAYSLFHSVGGSCSCLGPLISISHPVSLAIDAVMLLMAVHILLHKDAGEFLSLGPSLSRLKLGLGRRFIFEKASKFALVAIAVLVIGMPLAVGAQSSAGTNPGNGDTQSLIDDALDSNKPAFLFFSDCRSCIDSIKELAQEDYGENHTYGDLIAFIYISSGDHQAVEQFGVDEFPTMLLITAENGEGNYTFAYQRYGSVDEEELREACNQVLGGGTGEEQSPIDSMIDSALESNKTAFLVFYESDISEVSDIVNLEQELYDENHTYGDMIAFIYIGSEEDPQAVEQFGVDEFPTMLLITAENGEGNYTFAYQRSGSVNETELREACNQVLGGDTGEEQSSIDSIIDDALDSDTPAFLVFYECYICEVKDIASLEQQDYDENHTYGDLIAFIYISSEEDPQAVEQFGVDEFPAMFLITAENGEWNYTFAYQRSGSVNETELREACNQVLGGDTGEEQSSIDSIIDDALDSDTPAFLVFYEFHISEVSDIASLEQQDYDENHTYGDLIAFIYISSEEDPQAVEQFGVDEFPAMFLITAKNGEWNYTFVYQQSGSVNTAELRGAFNQVLGGGTGGEQSSIDPIIDDALDSGKPAFLFLYWGCSCSISTQWNIFDDLEQEYSDRIAFIPPIYIYGKAHPEVIKDKFNIIESPTILLITGKNQYGYYIYQRFDGFSSGDEGALRDAINQMLSNGST